MMAKKHFLFKVQYVTIIKWYVRLVNKIQIASLMKLWTCGNILQITSLAELEFDSFISSEEL